LDAPLVFPPFISMTTSLSYSCDSSLEDIQLLNRLNQSNYQGATRNLYPQGLGEYVFNNGTLYKGEFNQGMFHGKGVLLFPNGARYESQWGFGRLIEGQYYYSDNLHYNATINNERRGMSSSAAAKHEEPLIDPNSWQYCTAVDRRFWSEIQTEIKNSLEIQLTNRLIAARLPYLCYDVGEGYLNYADNKIYYYNGLYNRDSTADEVEWAHKKCRCGLDPSVQHIPFSSDNIATNNSLSFTAPTNQHEKSSSAQ
jgi:hypothetical protein